jgi:hypothetical protein
MASNKLKMKKKIPKKPNPQQTLKILIPIKTNKIQFYRKIRKVNKMLTIKTIMLLIIIINILMMIKKILVR